MLLEYPDTPPLVGSFRLPLILVEISIVLLAFDVAGIYFKKYTALKNTLKATRIHAAWVCLFLGYGAMEFCYWLADFYTMSTTGRYLYLQLGYFCAASGTFFFIYHVEHLVFVSRYRIFTKIYAGLYIVLIILIVVAFFIDVGSLVQVFTATFWIPNIGLVARYLFQIIKLSRGSIRTRSLFVIIGSTMLILGMLGNADIVYRAFGWGMRFLADLFQGIGIIVMTWSSMNLPTWKELEWKNDLDSLYVMYKGGTLAYEYDFGKSGRGIDKQQSSITVAQLEAARLSLDSELKSGELKILDFKEKKIYFETGEFITVIIVATTESRKIDLLIKKIRKEFEKLFRDQLPDWDGDHDVFFAATSLIGRILS